MTRGPGGDVLPHLSAQRTARSAPRDTLRVCPAIDDGDVGEAVRSRRNEIEYIGYPNRKSTVTVSVSRDRARARRRGRRR
jgi:hypothetical protein